MYDYSFAVVFNSFWRKHFTVQLDLWREEKRLGELFNVATKAEIKFKLDMMSMLQMFCTVRVCKNVIDQTWEKPKLSWKQCFCTRARPKTLPNLLVTGSPTRPPFSQASLGGSPSWLIHIKVGRIQFLRDVGLKPPSGPCHMGLSSEHLRAWQLAASEQTGGWRRDCGQEGSTVLCDLILQVTACHLCHILFTRS